MSFVDAAVWTSIKDELSRRLPHVLFEQWFSRAEIMVWDGHTLELGVQNRFFKSRIETTYMGVLKEAAEAALGVPVLVSVTVSPKLLAAFRKIQAEEEEEAGKLRLEEQPAFVKAPEEAASKAKERGVPLNHAFTFDSFVVGSSNRLSHAVALRAVDNPGEFPRIHFCGQHGVGKTHLLQAICHAAADRADARIVYVTAEKFTASFTSAHTSGKLKEFRAFYRNLDLLAFDELQALGSGNKVATQAELLRIVDELGAHGGQVVFASTRTPAELEGVDDKLRDRLGAGFVDKISLPDEDTRYELIQRKMLERRIELPKPALCLLAKELTGNVRRLEGTVQRLAALIELEGMEPTTNCIRMALEVSSPAARRSSLNFQDIVDAVAGEFGTTSEAVRGRGRSQTVRKARQVALVLCRRLIGVSYAELGEFFGSRTHATVLSTFRTLDADMFSSGLEGRPVERILFRLGLSIKPEELLERQTRLFDRKG